MSVDPEPPPRSPPRLLPPLPGLPPPHTHGPGRPGSRTVPHSPPPNHTQTVTATHAHGPSRGGSSRPSGTRCTARAAPATRSRARRVLRAAGRVCAVSAHTALGARPTRAEARSGGCEEGYRRDTSSAEKRGMGQLRLGERVRAGPQTGCSRARVAGGCGQGTRLLASESPTVNRSRQLVEYCWVWRRAGHAAACQRVARQRDTPRCGMGRGRGANRGG